MGKWVILKKSLVVSLFAILFFLLVGSVAAASNSSLTLEEVESSSYAVQNFTSSTGDIPGYVIVSDKNVTDEAYLEVLCKAVVNVNSNMQTSVSVVARGNAPSPSGTASGTLTKSQYITVANNIKSFYTSNGRAPNYAESALGNIRYETLVCMYSKIMNYYRLNNQLPSSISFSHVSGVSSGGAVVDVTPPTDSNNLAGGTYNSTKNVTLTASDNKDANPKVYYSLNNGTWSNQVKTVNLSLGQGRTDLRYYGMDASGNVGTTQTVTYIIDMEGPTVTASPTGSCYNVSKLVSLSAVDNFDANPVIYYTLDGSDPSNSSRIYLSPLNITNTSILKFMAIDNIGNAGPISKEIYTIGNSIFNINTGKSYSKIQDAINDPLTLDGNIIEVDSGVYTENIVVNKNLIILPVSGADVTFHALNSSCPVFTVTSFGNGTSIEGFTILGAINASGVYLNSTTGCYVDGNSLRGNLYGVTLSNSISNSISGNKVLNNSNSGIFLSNSSSNLIRDNVAINNTNYGILINTNSNSNLIQNNTLSGNKLSNNSYGIVIDNNSSNNIIQYNTVTNSTAHEGIGIYRNSNNNRIQYNDLNSNYYGTYIWNCSNNKIQGNAIYNNTDGIYLYSSNNNYIWDNIISINSWIAIAVYYSNNTTIQSNDLSNNLWYGVYLNGSQKATIIENTISGNIYGINPQYSSVDIHFNRIMQCSWFGLINQFNSVTNATNNWWGNSTPVVRLQTPSDIYVQSGTVNYSSCFPADIGFNLNQVVNASVYVKNYIETNHQLPNTVNMSGIQVTMPQFLHLSTTTLLNLEYDYLNKSIVLGDMRNATNSTEDIMSGDIESDEYDAIALYVRNYMEVNGTAPNYAYQTSLGTHMGFSSLVYMYSQILNFYATNNSTLPEYVTITPWIAVSNPNAIYNYQTLKVFNTIQAAIDDNATQGIHTIGIGIANISENVIVNKTVVITSVPSVNVTVQALNPTLPVFTITTYGSGSTIQDLIIKGSNNAGIYINNSFYNTISGDIISNNYHGIVVEESTDNQIADSLISNNTGNGILLRTGSDENNIAGNNIINNTLDGISISESINNLISNNMILNNSRDGIHFYNASGNVNFNRITGNGRYGVNNEGNGTIDATNNWWGSNTPNTLSNDVNGENITYNPWLVLNVTSSCDRSNCTGTTYNYIVTADLTHNNQGEDTSNGNSPSNKNYPDTLPDEVPVNFITTFGNITAPSTTRNGKSVAILNSTSAGLANIIVSLDNQNVTLQVNVTATDVLGIYNNRTGEGFRTIQDAINSNNTLDGDTILLADGTYSENVVVFKTLHIMPFNGANVTVQAADSAYGVFTIIGTGSSIQNLTITGSANSYGIMGYADNLQITGNTITANSGGISLFNSNNSQITGNNININWYGIVLYNSNGVNITNNDIIDNWYGMTISDSNSGIISENNIRDNWYGIFVNIANNTTINNNNITKNNIGISLFNSNSTSITTNNVTDNQAGISHYQSNNTISGNNITNNAIVNIQQVDTTGVVMQSNIWNCGPASLATVLTRLGINATQGEIADLAETDKEGTSMYGLVYAAQHYGLLNSTGLIVPVDQLQANNIVLITMAGLYHFSVITNITNGTVYLADSAFGNINMSIENFTAMYSGYCVIITNSTTNTTNCTNLSYETMQSIKGTFVFLAIPASYYVGAAIYLGICYLAYEADNYIKERNNPIKSKISTSSPVTVNSGPTQTYKKAKRYTKPKTTTNAYGKLGSGYVSPRTGYTPTPTVNPVDVAYQQAYKKYEDQKTGILDKILNALDQKKQSAVVENPFMKKRIEQFKQAGSPIPDDDDGRIRNISVSIKNAWKTFKEGVKTMDPQKVITGGWILSGAATVVATLIIDANAGSIKGALNSTSLPP